MQIDQSASCSLGPGQAQVSSPNPGRPEQEQTPHPESRSLPRCSFFWSDQSGFLP